VTELAFTIPDELVEAIAERVAAMLEERAPVLDGSPWLTVDEAADYLRCSRQRIYDLRSAGRLNRHKDGSRVLVSRTELERLVASELPRPSRNGSARGSAR
jgi:excisionase family DNA binding protein